MIRIETLIIHSLQKEFPACFNDTAGRVLPDFLSTTRLVSHYDLNRRVKMSELPLYRFS